MVDSGLIFNIQRFSVHDGPGIRTTVFLKGCPLNCWWCHNPESQNTKCEIMYWEKRCTKCGICVKTCPNGAIRFADTKILLNRSKCQLCEKCINQCPQKAIEVSGKMVSVQYIIQEIMKDNIFYDQSGGGVTFSGGEPLIQIEFLYKLLCACKEETLHTAVDTSGFVPWQNFKIIIDKTDLFLYDLKLMDRDKHKTYTGVDNNRILENLRELKKNGCNVNVRIPIIPGINDDKENIYKTGEFLAGIKINQVNLLPYHNIAIDKYTRLSLIYKLKELKTPSENDLERIAGYLKEFNLNIKIGG